MRWLGFKFGWGDGEVEVVRLEKVLGVNGVVELIRVIEEVEVIKVVNRGRQFKKVCPWRTFSTDFGPKVTDEPRIFVWPQSGAALCAS